MILTLIEFNANKNKLLIKFAAAWFDDMNRHVWLSGPKGIKKGDAKLLWLFVWALNDYTHSSSVTSNLTEVEVMKIFAKVNTIQ